MVKHNRTMHVGVVVIVLVILSIAIEGYAKSPFFTGKTLTFIVATNPGGTYDNYARLIAPYLVKHLGVSKVIVRNMPGAGHIKGLNALYEAEPDGLTIGISNVGGLVYGQLAGKEGIRFDLKKLIWLANPVVDPRVLVISGREPYKDIREAAKAKKEIRVSSSGVGTTSHTDPLFINVILGTNFRPIAGYSSTSEALLAIERGEVGGRIGTYSLYYAPLIQNKTLRPILLVGNKRPDLPRELQGVPWLMDIASQDATLVNLLNVSADLWGPIAAPPGLPKEKTAALLEAFGKALSDPGWVEAASKSLVIPKYDNSRTTTKMMTDSLNQPPEVVTLIKGILAAK